MNQALKRDDVADARPADIKFAYWVPNVSGGLVISKIEQRTELDARIQHQARANCRTERASNTRSARSGSPPATARNISTNRSRSVTRCSPRRRS